MPVGYSVHLRTPRHGQQAGARLRRPGTCMGMAVLLVYMLMTDAVRLAHDRILNQIMYPCVSSVAWAGSLAAPLPRS